MSLDTDLIPASEVVARARSQIGRKTKYELGRGGHYPDSLMPADSVGRCDCSGFVAWCFREPRKVQLSIYKPYLGNWVETSAIVRDAHRIGVGLFDIVTTKDALPGMVLVYGDKGKGQGHVGIISEIGPLGPAKVVHCSKGNFDNFGDAVRETGPEIFVSHGAIVARCIAADYGVVGVG